MKRVLCSRLPTRGNPTTLSPAEAHHLTHVLRQSEGAKVEAMDGHGKAARTILRVRGEAAFLELDAEAPAATRSADAETVPVTLEMAILKGEAMEWVVEKAVELGVRVFQPVMTAHTV
ncbi:MAG: RsmE family RNA methyltransferase, partial [Bdellovibrionota bacterium]